MDFMMHLFQGAGSIISFVGTIFWIVMMIDCLRSRIRHKGRWMIFMLFTNWVGAVVYFFVVRPTILNPVFNFLQNMFLAQRLPVMRQQQPPQNRVDPLAPTPPYRDYQQGYKVQEPYYQPTASSSQPLPQAAPEQLASYPSYEQPQASYPEMPPMQQQ